MIYCLFRTIFYNNKYILCLFKSKLSVSFASIILFFYFKFHVSYKESNLKNNLKFFFHLKENGLDIVTYLSVKYVSYFFFHRQINCKISKMKIPTVENFLEWIIWLSNEQSLIFRYFS